MEKLKRTLALKGTAMVCTLYSMNHQVLHILIIWQQFL